MSTTLRDDLISTTIDLDAGREIKEGVFNFEMYRRPELYKMISEPMGSMAKGPRP